MSNLPALFFDLALILVTAGIVTVIFKWLKQPLVLGYIVAGFLIGPYFTYFPVIVDTKSVEVWSEIGMVFLLFALGLDFSFKKLKKVGGTGAITVLTELIIMSTVGFCIGKILGWSQMDSIFLGCMLSISSTTIIVKAFDDLKLKKEKFTGNVIGGLVVEDLTAVLIMVILSTISVSKSFNGMELLYSMLKLAFFLIIWFLFGIYLIPSLLKITRKFMTEETLVIFSIGLCFIMVVFANYAGFSSALGAFIMGSILAETLEAETISRLTAPIKNLFGAVFFVSVGMMVDPKILIQYAWPILIIAVTIMVVKTFSATLGLLISGNGLKSSIQSGFCFCQIGEFSFIIASLGLSFKVIDSFLYPIIVSVSIVTTFFTPYIIRLGLPFYNLLLPHIPKKWKSAFSNYNSGFKVNNKTLNIGTFLTRQLKNLVIYAAIIMALSLLSFGFLGPFCSKYIPGIWANITSVSITLIVLAPFLWAMAFKYNITLTNKRLLTKNKFNKTIILIIFILRYILAIVIIYLIVSHFINIRFWGKFGISFAFSIILIFSNHIMRFYQKIEDRFMDNLNKRQSQAAFVIPEILQENFHLEKMVISPQSKIVGKKLKDTKLRSKYNISVVCIERGDKIFDLPDNDMIFYPYDKITVVGNDEKINILKPEIEIENNVLIRERKESNFNLHKSYISPQHPIYHKTLRESGVKEIYNSMIIAVERNGKFILNPPASLTFENDDIIWFVCDDSTTSKLLYFKK